VAELVQQLGLTAFPQFSDGDVVFQRMSREAPRRLRSLPQEPESMRIAGGTGALVRALAAGLPEHAIHLQTRVTRVARSVGTLELELRDADGTSQTVQAAHAILALPPRLLAATISFSPPLDQETARRWRSTATWMAPHAKFFACYERPFWREHGLSGTAQSMVGPLVELHDATTVSGKAALFGFIGVPADQREAMGREALIGAALEQLAKLFGHEARSPTATLLKDWSADPLTATLDDRVGGAHPAPTTQPWVTGEWREHLSLAGSETSRSEPGYLAGAIEAAEYAVAETLRALRTLG
jgi:monoamine oxidase